MKNLWVVLVFILIVSCDSSSKEKSVELTVEAKKVVEGQWVKLEKVTDGDISVVDSFQLAANEPMKRTVIVDMPMLYRVNFFGRQFVNVILNDADVQVVAEGDSPRGSATVTGSEDTDNLGKVARLEQEFQAQVNRLNGEFVDARNAGDLERAQSLQQAYIALDEGHEQNIKKLIWEMDNSIAALLATNYLKDTDRYFLFLDSLATKFEELLPESPYTASLVKRVTAVKNTAIGATAPEINLPTPAGENLALSSLRGKYVLVDFWAAWCRPCRVENPNVVRVYAKYADKGFEVYGVSLDRKREDWLQAIQADGLPWKHVSDLKYWQSEGAQAYKVSAIPATFLLDPEGKIIGKNLRGEALEAKLKEIFG